MKYQTTLLEDWIHDFLNNLGIYQPHQLNLEVITQRLGLHVVEKSMKSRVLEGVVFIDSRLSEQEKWQEFAHELMHFLRHAGNQLLLPKAFVDLQEKQAENFALHLCVPTFMLLNYKVANYTNLEDGIRFISDTFNVTEKYAQTRLQHFRNRLFQTKADEEHRRFMNALYPKAQPYSEETNAILAELQQKILIRKGDSYHATATDLS
ncbi:MULTISPECIES: ImmA/IrrE family metallo-endopeptidase [Niallia]|uniref:ImmA/IrrE family metallo-endopeptidase n=1 Tax=Niallia TaxID=2837506 RepID=UPI002E20A349|nr:ImmA/IrrE family metallo-endopeptidase [Niallia circulans]